MEQPEYMRMFKQENEYWWYRGLHDLVEYFIRKRAGSLNNISIFDAGCGTGRMLEIAKKYGNVAGIDFSGDAVEFCRQRGLNDVVQGDLNTWKCGASHYDVIYSLDVLYHRGIIDQEKILSEFAQALKPEGLLILNLAAFKCLYRNHDRVVHTARRYTKNEVASLLRKAGFTVLYNNYRLPVLFPVILLKKLFEKADDTESDLDTDLNPITNALLYTYNRLENIVHRLKVPLPFGTSVFTVAVKQ